MLKKDQGYRGSSLVSRAQRGEGVESVHGNTPTFKQTSDSERKQACRKNGLHSFAGPCANDYSSFLFS